MRSVRCASASPLICSIWPPPSSVAGGRLAARVSQQELADAVGSVREVVARALRDLRAAGIVATAADRVVILDPARLYGETGGPAGV